MPPNLLQILNSSLWYLIKLLCSSEKKERHPFHDSEQITISLNYHEKISPIRKEEENNEPIRIRIRPRERAGSQKYGAKSSLYYVYYNA
jgi:hypothetical protein